MLATTHPRDVCSVPPYTLFTNSVLKVLGRRTKLRPNSVVELDDVLRAEILMDAGFNPTDLPKTWPANPKSKTPAGIDTTINCAYRFLHHKTHCGRHGNAQVLSFGRGKWGLTPIGVVEARRLLTPCEPKPRPNETARWLSKHLTPKRGQRESELMRIMKSAIAKKCRISAERDVIEDHLQEFFVRLIRRNALHKHLETGRGVTYTHLASYAVNSARTDIRDAATEPVSRELFGARTERERQDAAMLVKKCELQGTSPLSVRTDTKQVHMNEQREVIDIVDDSPLASETLADRIRFELVWSRIESIMRAAKPRAWGRYASILRLQVLGGYSVKEIASFEGVSPHRAASMLQDARKAVRVAGRDSFVF